MKVKKTDAYYYIGSEDEPLARADYRIEDNNLYIDYVYVSPQMRGQGMAADLIEEITQTALENNQINIVPKCTYAVKYLQNK